MGRALLILLAALSGGTFAHAADRGPAPWHNDRFSTQHQQEKKKEQRVIALRVRKLLQASTERREAQYAQNRQRCQAALRVAELCGKFAGAFYCDDKGFQPVAASAMTPPAAMDNSARYRMEHCALDVARRGIPMPP